MCQTHIIHINFPTKAYLLASFLRKKTLYLVNHCLKNTSYDSLIVFLISMEMGKNFSLFSTLFYTQIQKILLYFDDNVSMVMDIL